jgi:hypothetical protein
MILFAKIQHDGTERIAAAKYHTAGYRSSYHTAVASSDRNVLRAIAETPRCHGRHVLAADFVLRRLFRRRAVKAFAADQDAAIPAVENRFRAVLDFA